MAEPNPAPFTFDDLRPSFSLPTNSHLSDLPSNFQEMQSHNPFENTQYELEQFLKKRRLNDNSCQAHPTTTSPKHLSKIARDLSIGLDPNFPVIQEIDENQTPTLPKETPSHKTTPFEPISGMNSLKRRLITDVPELSSSVVISQARSELKSIENKYEELFKKFKESPRTETKEEVNLNVTVSFPKPEGKLSKIQAKILSKETRYTSGQKPSCEKDEYQKLRRTLNEHLKYEEPGTPFKRKVTMPAQRGGSQSVSKFHMQQPSHHWSAAKKPDAKRTPTQSDNFQFKARPMPRYLPFEAKKSDLPCVIPKEFHLKTEARAIKHNSKDSLEKQFMTEAGKFRVSRSVSKADLMAQSHFKALPLPDFSRPFRPKVGTSPLTEIDELRLKTESRAEKRTEFDSYLKEREQSREAIRQQQEEERKRKEQEEIAELRKNMVFRARPYKSPSPAIKDGNKGFIVPPSPKTAKKL